MPAQSGWLGRARLKDVAPPWAPVPLEEAQRLNAASEPWILDTRN